MRRMFWMGVGAAAGASGTVWAQRRVRERIEALGAEQVVSAAGRGARSVGRTLRAALDEGRDGMAEREVELRGRILGTEASLDLRRGPGSHVSGSGRRRGARNVVPARRSGR